MLWEGMGGRLCRRRWGGIGQELPFATEPHSGRSSLFYLGEKFLSEDVGGAPGYEEFIAALADPNHLEHGDLKAWIGGAFDSAAFDVAEVNQRLSTSE